MISAKRWPPPRKPRASMSMAPTGPGRGGLIRECDAASLVRQLAAECGWN
jgi:hypothetical protein